MTRRGRMADFCRTLLLAASFTALSATLAHPQDLADLNDQILQNPQDAELNLRYARAAEEAGQIRLALAAYERVMINDPDNVEARRGYERIRRIIEPPFTTLRTEVGVRWDSNPSSTAFSDEEAYSVFANATLMDERLLGGRRWRSVASFEAEIVPDIDELDHAYLGAQTGPLFHTAPHVATIPSIGAGVAMLDGDHYFSEINAGVTVEGKNSGVSWWTRFRAGWRDYADDATADEGVYGEVTAGLSIPRIAAETDTLVLVPWVRVSDIDGSTFSFITGDIAPGQFYEFGLDATYHYQVNDHVRLSAGAMARQREYTETMVGPDERSDTYVAPEVAVTFENIMPCECGIRLAYQYRDNESNDPTYDFDASQVSLSFLSRF